MGLQCGARKCLLVGDPHQLRSTVISPAAVQAGFDRSVLERLMLDCRAPYSMLDVQYRMHPHIAAFPAARLFVFSWCTDSFVMSNKRRTMRVP